MNDTSRTSWYTRFAKGASHLSGRPITFTLAAAVILVWIISGPFFDFSDTWQLVINTATTIVTFLMVFLIQNTQNRDTAAIQIKLDELIRVTGQAHNYLLDLEELEDDQLEQFRSYYLVLAKKGKEKTSAVIAAADAQPGELLESGADSGPPPRPEEPAA